MRTTLICSFFFAFFLIFSHLSYAALLPQQPVYPATADLSATWSIDMCSSYKVVLQRGNFLCGFICDGNCTSCLFAILISLRYNTPDVIWSANRDNPVRGGAILNLTAAGELVLHDVDGSIVWTTNTRGKSVAGMKLTNKGNLMLFDVNNLTIWQSFDHPTDCLVEGQKLFEGQKLTTSTNWTAQKDSYSLQVTNEGLFAYVGSNPPQVYYRYLVEDMINTNNERSYVELSNAVYEVTSTTVPGKGSYIYDHDYYNQPFSSRVEKRVYHYFVFYTGPNDWKKIGIDPPFTPLYMKLMPDGHLKAFGTQASDRPAEADLLTDNNDFGECSYPLACGRNAICSRNKQCSCPGVGYFRAVNDLQPNNGCSRVTPLTCNNNNNNNATQDQHFIRLNNVTYFTYTVDMEDVDMETCKQACLNNCSCEAAIFKYGSNFSSGNCSIPSELFTMTSVDAGVRPNKYHSWTFIKVQNGIPTNMSQTVSPITKSKRKVRRVLGSTVGSLMLLLIVVAGFTKCILQKQKMEISETEEEYLDQLPGLPTRFSYKELQTATENFSKRLGEGGFGTVFEGSLQDGSRIAVKCLQGLAHVMKSFMVEVKSIGSVHHVNLVQLRGFCAWKSERLLVYDFMSKGSLDQWIYHGDRKSVLEWVRRKKIILDIAKGLAYLHEECRQKIIHLDIKPHNILLDEDFNAKVSDFGLAKFMDKNQSRQVISTMGGTPAYMAPEWLTSIITEKMDVYSFGIVLLEILCGRKILDGSQPEESCHLLCVFRRCWEQGTLLDIVDRYSEDMQTIHGTEVMEMMKVASWCLQTDFTKRPSMSSVVKVLQGLKKIESNLDYDFLCTQKCIKQQMNMRKAQNQRYHPLGKLL